MILLCKKKILITPLFLVSFGFVDSLNFTKFGYFIVIFLKKIHIMCRRHRKSTLEVSDIKKHHNVRYVSLHSRLSALQRILLIFPTECEASCKIPLLSPAEGVNEL